MFGCGEYFYFLKGRMELPGKKALPNEVRVENIMKVTATEASKVQLKLNQEANNGHPYFKTIIRLVTLSQEITYPRYGSHVAVIVEMRGCGYRVGVVLRDAAGSSH